MEAEAEAEASPPPAALPTLPAALARRVMARCLSLSGSFLGRLVLRHPLGLVVTRQETAERSRRTVGGRRNREGTEVGEGGEARAERAQKPLEVEGEGEGEGGGGERGIGGGEERRGEEGVPSFNDNLVGGGQAKPSQAKWSGVELSFGECQEEEIRYDTIRYDTNERQSTNKSIKKLLLSWKLTKEAGCVK